ncbi:MAG: succinate dehydrogenase cytochrome b subunit [Roseiflexaceae bacterium]
MTAVMTVYRSSIGKKAVMAITGFILVGFVVAHMIGNLKVYTGAEHLNAYAGFLREVGDPLVPHETLLWIARIVLLGSVVLHIMMAYQLSRKSWDGRPIKYDQRRDIQATYASRTMRWGGVILLLFIIYHILHLTLGMVGYNPGVFQPEDPNNGFQTYANVVNGFQNVPVSLFYILAMGALCLHLYHGTWSMFQTLGLNNNQTNSIWRWVSIIVAVAVFVGNVSIPIAVMAGFVR